MCTSS
ncbi:unnamed protein product [Linum tenue]